LANKNKSKLKVCQPNITTKPKANNSQDQGKKCRQSHTNVLIQTIKSTPLIKLAHKSTCKDQGHCEASNTQNESDTKRTYFKLH
jgi:hypothetical protein